MNVREYACNTLLRVVQEHGYANLILRDADHDLNEADQALASELVYGTLRNYPYLEFQWRDLASGRVKPRVAMALDLSIYQLFFLDRIPDYAILNEAAALVNPHERNFVNAILRKVQERGLRHAEMEDELERTSIETSHPLWILKLWSAHYGTENAIRIAQHDQERPMVYGRLNTLKLSRQELEKEEGITFLDDLTFTYSGKPLAKTDWFLQGKIMIQDWASSEIPKYLDVKPGMRVLDTCAAPGTKTQETAMLMKNQGEIIATDIYPARVQLIESLAKFTGVSIIHTKVQDATKVDESFESESFDRILIDAPCSGLGDLSHKPEIRLHVKPEDLDELVATQKAILNTSAGYLKHNGILVYSTCTLDRKENESQVKAFLKEHTDFELLEEKTWLPFEKNSDGFFAAKFRKK